MCSARPERAQEIASRFDIPATFDDYREMLNRVRPDVVSVVTPPVFHREMVLASLEMGAHVLCEKPLAMTLADALSMYEAGCKAGVVHATDFEFRFMPQRQAIRGMVRAGRLGALRFAQVSQLYLSPGYEQKPLRWWSLREKGGGVLLGRASHAFDSMRFWFGEFAGITGLTQTYVHERLNAAGESVPVDADDAYAFLGRMDNGAVVVGTASQLAHHGNGGIEGRYELYGDLGTILLDGAGQLSFAGPDGVEVIPADYPDDFPKALPDQWLIRPFYRLLKQFVAATRAEPSEVPTFLDGVRAQQLIEGVFTSQETGRWQAFRHDEMEPGTG